MRQMKPPVDKFIDELEIVISAVTLSFSRKYCLQQSVSSLKYNVFHRCNFWFVLRKSLKQTAIHSEEKKNSLLCVLCFTRDEWEMLQGTITGTDGSLAFFSPSFTNRIKMCQECSETENPVETSSPHSFCRLDDTSIYSAVFYFGLLI